MNHMARIVSLFAYLLFAELFRLSSVVSYYGPVSVQAVAHHKRGTLGKEKWKIRCVVPRQHSSYSAGNTR